MTTVRFNVSGKFFEFSQEKLQEYSDSLFSLIANTQITAICDRTGAYFLNRNPSHAGIIYGSIVHNFSIMYFMTRVMPQITDRFELGDLVDEFAYYGVCPVYSGQCIVRVQKIDDKLTIDILSAGTTVATLSYCFRTEFIDSKIDLLKPVAGFLSLKIPRLPTLELYWNKPINSVNNKLFFAQLYAGYTFVIIRDLIAEIVLSLALSKD